MMTDEEYEHGQVVEFPHGIVKGDMNHPKDEDYTDIPCDGVVKYDGGLEGLICSKCELYTGFK